MTIALDRVTAAYGNANVRAFLRVIREGESDQTDDAYRIINGGAHFDAPPWRHPWHGIPTTQGAKASGAYQFLGTTWASCSDALGLGGDFAPISQDLAAVYLIEGRGALPAVMHGDLHLACSKLAQEWVSLPGMSLQRVRQVFSDYGGSQDDEGEWISPPVTPTPPEPPKPAPAPDLTRLPTSTPEKPMFAMLLPALLGLIPQLAPILGPKTAGKVEQYGQLAQAITQAITQATGTPNLQAGLEAMQADPEVKAKTANAVLSTPAVAAVMESQEAGGGGIAGARRFALEGAGIPFWRRGEFLISILLLALVYMIVIAVLFISPTLWSATDRSQILMLAVAVTSGVMGYWIGSSIGSMRKTEISGAQ